MLNCKKITELVSLECEQPLNFKQKLQLKLHLMMCPRCRSFYKNCHIVEKYVKELKH